MGCNVSKTNKGTYIVDIGDTHLILSEDEVLELDGLINKAIANKDKVSRTHTYPLSPSLNYKGQWERGSCRRVCSTQLPKEVVKLSKSFKKACKG